MSSIGGLRDTDHPVCHCDTCHRNCENPCTAISPSEAECLKGGTCTRCKSDCSSKKASSHKLDNQEYHPGPNNKK